MVGARVIIATGMLVWQDSNVSFDMFTVMGPDRSYVGPRPYDENAKVSFPGKTLAIVIHVTDVNPVSEVDAFKTLVLTQTGDLGWVWSSWLKKV